MSAVETFPDPLMGYGPVHMPAGYCTSTRSVLRGPLGVPQASSGSGRVPIATAVSSRVLIADSHGESGGQLAAWLGASGHHCTPAATADALTAVRRLAPDVAVVAVRGSDDGGMWVVRALRAQHPETAVVVIASPPDFDVAVTANRLGVVDCLPGPPTRGAVTDAVNRAELWRTATAAARSNLEMYADELEQQRSRMHDAVAQVEPDAAQAVLLALLESRSPDTHDHSQRVAGHAASLARRCGLSAAAVQRVERAALLHDIGKIAMPTELLGDTRRLSAEEVEMLRQHVTLGAELLMALPSLSSLAPIVAATHERVDGGGYPNGLAGEAIPIEARIIAVADTFDAMTGVREYREPVSRDQANAELVRASGSHLDSAIVRAWLGVTEEVRCS